jgi:hypothetical protein
MTELDLGSARVDLTVDHAARMELPFTLTIGGVLQDWVGWSASFAVERAPGEVPLLELTEADGVTLGPADGVGLVEVTAEQMTELPPRALYYRLRVSSTADGVVPLLHGLYTVRET